MLPHGDPWGAGATTSLCNGRKLFPKPDNKEDSSEPSNLVANSNWVDLVRRFSSCDGSEIVYCFKCYGVCVRRGVRATGLW